MFKIYWNGWCKSRSICNCQVENLNNALVKWPTVHFLLANFLFLRLHLKESLSKLKKPHIEKLSLCEGQWFISTRCKGSCHSLPGLISTHDDACIELLHVLKLMKSFYPLLMSNLQIKHVLLWCKERNRIYPWLLRLILKLTQKSKKERNVRPTKKRLKYSEEMNSNPNIIERITTCF